MATTPHWLTPPQLRAWKSMSLMNLQLQARLSRGLSEHGLSYQDYLVLATLSDQPDGRRRVVELSDELGWEKSRLSHHITRMRERRLVDKEPCPSDQRGTYVTITARGRDTLTAAAPDHVADVQRYFFELLSPEQVVTLGDLADAVLGHLAQVH